MTKWTMHVYNIPVWWLMALCRAKHIKWNYDMNMTIINIELLKYCVLTVFARFIRISDHIFLEGSDVFPQQDIYSKLYRKSILSRQLTFILLN